jgi:hypothetical protein
MEILSAGAFINLENQEKIEQLKFTAVELANAALAAEGFTNTEESCKSLALEFWQGLEYMCPESEEAAIKNIFLNHFLDRLRQFRPSQPATFDSAQDSALENESVPVDETNPEDEFLGVIDTAESEESSIEETPAVTQESLAQTQDFLTLEKDSFQEVGVKTTENSTGESVEDSASSIEEIEGKVEFAPEDTVEDKTTVGNLSLPEKEPYNFGKCTVTATIQMLPVADDDGNIRKTVLSVRTHDFAPQISMVELTAGNNLLAELAPELEKVFAKYRNDLPAKVMDKLKKEKTAAKKTAPKTAAETKPVSQATAKPKESIKSETAPSEPIQTDAPVVIPPATLETGQQGSLFGF